ncbi:hypothetical protein L6452_18673 [Arctium lappa]|uniref:Uncharacterized protein n=1 Tax=Arctium lappa TaxID=4217 RepID=A0ACB9C6W7_ARCLA|nr:hypothetical protein L6452_18673 [Arctium lappa]
MVVVANHPVKGEKPLYRIRSMSWVNDVVKSEISCIGMNKVSSSVVTGDVDIAIVVSDETTDKWWEMSKSSRKTFLKKFKKENVIVNDDYGLYALIIKLLHVAVMLFVKH